MTITVNTKAYNFDTNLAPNIAQYTGPANNFQVKDLITLKRTAPKPTKDFAGVAKSSSKITRTLTLADGSKADALIETSVSIPVGAVIADVDALRSDSAAVTSSAVGSDLHWKLDISQ
jgi:hypothetical protein